MRTGPNDLSFASVEAYRDIYGHVGQDKKRFIKSAWYEREEPRLVTVRDPAEHAMQRRALSHAFSARALRDQEELVHQYVDLFVQQLGNLGDNGRKGVNVTDAYNWLTFDIIGSFVLNLNLNLNLIFISLFLHHKQWLSRPNCPGRFDRRSCFWRTIRGHSRSIK